MHPNRKAAVSAGVLFIIATAANVLGTSLSKSLLDKPDYLARVAANANLVTAGAFLELIAAFACAGIAIALYPVLRKSGPGLALGSVVFRSMEAVMYVVAVVSLLCVLVLSGHFTTAVAGDHGAIQAVGDSLLAIREQVIVPAVLAFSLGAFLYYYVFYRSRLIPRWLSGWGIIAILLTAAASLLALFTRNAITTYTVMVLPIAVQEMVLAVWLIAKGFSTPVLQEEPSHGRPAPSLQPRTTMIAPVTK